MPKESIKIGLVCDGTSDYGIQHAVDWLMAQHFDNVPYRFLIAKQVIPARGPLGDRLRKAVELYLPDILICHRDSEGGDFTVRNAEIEQAANGLLTPVVKAVPVRMIESWLLLDAAAIRSAAMNRNGRMELVLPRTRHVEDIPDPKSLVLSLVSTASGFDGRRLQKFNSHRARSRISSFISDWSLLRDLPSFARFESELTNSVGRLVL